MRGTASKPCIDRSVNTTNDLLAETEHLRKRLGIEQWPVFWGSRGTALDLAYVERNRDRVTELVLTAVITT